MKKIIGYIATAFIIILFIAQCGEDDAIEKPDETKDTTEQVIKKKEKPKVDFKDERYKLGNWITSSGGTNIEISILSSNKYIYISDLTGATMGNWDGNNEKIVFYHEQYNVPIAEAKIHYSGELQFRDENGTLFLTKK